MCQHKYRLGTGTVRFMGKGDKNVPACSPVIPRLGFGHPWSILSIIIYFNWEKKKEIVVQLTFKQIFPFMLFHVPSCYLRLAAQSYLTSCMVMQSHQRDVCCMLWGCFGLQRPPWGEGKICPLPLGYVPAVLVCQLKPALLISLAQVCMDLWR